MLPLVTQRTAKLNEIVKAPITVENEEENNLHVIEKNHMLQLFFEQTHKCNSHALALACKK